MALDHFLDRVEMAAVMVYKQIFVSKMVKIRYGPEPLFGTLFGGNPFHNSILVAQKWISEHDQIGSHFGSKIHRASLYLAVRRLRLTLASEFRELFRQLFFYLMMGVVRSKTAANRFSVICQFFKKIRSKKFIFSDRKNISKKS